MAKKQKQNESGLAADNLDGNVDKIRDILFGGQMRDYEQRFVDLEKRLSKSIELLSTNFEKRLDRLNDYTKREIDKLNEKVKAERAARRDDGKQGSKELKELSQQFESWYAELEEQLGAEAHDLRSLLQEQSEELAGLVRDSHDELTKNLTAETRHLDEGKLARDDMAALLTEVALRLKKDFKIPGA